MYSKLTSISSDNGGEARKSRNSIAKHFYNDKKFIFSIQCLLHQINLCFSSPLDEISIFKEVLEIVRFLRKKYFLKFKIFIGKNNVHLKRFVSTRWTSLSSVFESFLLLYHDIINFFYFIRNEKNESTETINDFLNVMENEQFYYRVCLFTDILIFEKKLIKKLQDEKNSIIEYFQIYYEFQNFIFNCEEIYNNMENGILLDTEENNVFLILKQKLKTGGYSLNWNELKTEVSSYFNILRYDFYNGNMGVGKRFCDFEECSYLYDVCINPLGCDIELYKKFTSIDENIVQNMISLRESIDEKYQNENIFSLSVSIANESQR